MNVWKPHQLTGPRFVVNFPSKESWRSGSKLDDIDHGPADLPLVIKQHGTTSIALPPLG